MKKQQRGVLLLWIFIAASVAGGVFLIVEHLGIGGSGDGKTGTGMAVQPSAEIRQDISTSETTTAATVSMQTFSNDGYEFNVPASWNIEKTGANTVALHSDAVCKIEISAYPFTSGADMADWIAHRIAADPSLTVAERSSENIVFASGSGVKWIGSIDNTPTTLVYAFNERHAYEIAPSVIGTDASGSAQCAAMLEVFLSGLKI